MTKTVNSDCSTRSRPYIQRCNTSSHSHLVVSKSSKSMEAVVSTNKKIRSSNYIPTEILFYILSKLPLKSLKRFQCVCKSWAGLFQNSYFMNMYRNNFLMSNRRNHCDFTYLVQHAEPPPKNLYNHPVQFYLLSGENFSDRVKIDWPPLHDHHDDVSDIYILGSVSINGILCLKKYPGQVLGLWNPITSEFKEIPHSPLESVPPHRTPWYLLHGFGYDPITNDYKVIQVVDSVDETSEDELNDDISTYELFWEIYSLRSNTWRKLDVYIPNHCDYTPTQGIGVYLNGMCHWWSRADGSTDIEEYLLSFDFSNEVLFSTPAPSYLDVTWMDNPPYYVENNLVILNESIALISTQANAFHISILGELGVIESWTELFIVECLPFIGRSIGIGKNNTLFVRKTNDEIARVDLNTNMIEELGFKASIGSHIGKYKKSFLSMEGTSN